MPAVTYPMINPLVIPKQDRDKIQAIYSQLTNRKPVQIVSHGGHRVEVPASLQRFLLHLLKDLRDGKVVTVVGSEQSLTTAQASGILGVSRQYFVNLLEGGAVPFHMVGSHRRVHLSDLLKYQRIRDRDRRKILDRMVQSEVEEGLYDLVRGNVQPRKRSRRPA